MLSLLVLCLLLAAAPAAAQSRTPGGMPPPTGMALAESAAMRFPQPVRAGQLIGELVLRPAESQPVLGRVRAVVRDAGGQVLVVVGLGGWFGGLTGLGERPVAVPVDAMVLLGQDMEVVAYGPAQLRRLPTFSPAGTTPVPPDATIRVGLAKPSH